MNDLRIFARRSFTGSITYDVIRKSSAAYFIPFFRGDVELLMRAYIALNMDSYGRIGWRRAPAGVLLCGIVHILGVVK